eukprot:g15927.t1
MSATDLSVLGLGKKDSDARSPMLSRGGAYGRSKRRLRPRFRRHSHLNAIYKGENEQGGKDFHFQVLSGEIAAKKRSQRRVLNAAMERRGAGKGKTQYSFLYRILSGRSRMRSAIVFNRCLATLIVLCVAAFVLESVPAFSSSKAAARAFYTFEAFASCIFLAEYLARLWTCVEARRYRMMSSWRARLCYVCTMRALVDLASCLPFFVELGGGELPTLTWLKAFRIFRILKSERYTRAFSSVYRVVWYNSEILGVALFIGLLLMMTTSTLLWYMAPKHNGTDDDADDFSSIPATFYLSILMLTGQGTPTGVLPWYTKVIVMLTAVFSVPIFVIPSSMLTWGFEAEAERLMRKKRETRKKIKLAELRGTRVVSSSSSEEENVFESDNEEAAWDEYERVVLGDDDDDGKKELSQVSKEDKKLMQDVSNYFAKADVDADGTLSMLEFYEFARSQRGKASPDRNAPQLHHFENRLDIPQLQHFENRLNTMEEKLDQLLIAMQPKSSER